MKRRAFIQSGSAAAFAFAIPVFQSCKTDPSPATTPIVPDTPTPFSLDEITIDQLQEKMQKGEYTSRSIAEMYLKQIDAIDTNGPALNAVIEINPDALTIADALDEERKQGKVRGPMHGIPVLIKDNIDTGDKMMTTAGALAMVGNVAALDAFIIRQLRASGAVVLGKTNLSEWANFRDDRSSSGWSSRGGQTRNPYILDRNPCGSSSGSGTAVAANLCAVAIGTETNGSIGCPSSINGLVGIKPTVGLLSRAGIIPISHTQDTAGPMTRTVKDAAYLLSALTGVDPADAVTQESAGKAQKDYTLFLDAKGLGGKRIGVDKSMLKGHEGVDKLLQEALEVMKTNGATVVEVELKKQMEGIGSAEFEVLQYEFKDGLNRYLAKSNARVKSLKDVIAFNKENEAKAMPYFKQGILESSEAKGDLKSKEYTEALQKILGTSRHAITRIITENKLDAICGPTNGPSWCTDLVNGDFFTGYGAYGPAAIAGYPHISVPMGLVGGLPVGLTLLGLPYGEPGLITLAYAYEQASHKRVAPQFRKSFSA